MIICHLLLGILVVRGCSAGSGVNWGAPKSSPKSSNAGSTTWGAPSALATEKAKTRLESTARIWGSAPHGKHQIPKSQLRGFSSTSSTEGGWGKPRASNTPIKERQVIGVINGPASVSNCTCVTTDLCRAEDSINQGEGVINPRHACAPDNICCIYPLTQPVSPGGCGVRNPIGSGLGALATRITTETATVLGEFPWMVAILESTMDGDVFVCGGSLIDPGVILTAAHCVENKDAASLKARVGEWDASTSTEAYASKDISVTKTISHPNYRAADLCNDVALMILAEDADISQPHIGLSCLPDTSDTYIVDQCVVTGWGKQAFQDAAFSAYMRKIQVPIVDFGTCQAMMQGTRLGNKFRLDPSFLCAGSPDADACTGDGGGPLICPLSGSPQTMVQVGIVSWGLGCGSVPGVYADLTKFTQWINDNVISQTIRF